MSDSSKGVADSQPIPAKIHPIRQYDDLSERLGQLSSLLLIAFSEEFHDFAIQTKTNYLWLASRTLDECIELLPDYSVIEAHQEFIHLYQKLTPEQQVVINNQILLSVQQVKS